MNIFSRLIPQDYLQALGWTLLHTVWQAAIIAVILGILMVFLQRSSQMRYIVSLGGLYFVLIAALVTFYLSYQSIKTSTVSTRAPINKVELQGSASSSIVGISTQGSGAQSIGIMDQFKTYFAVHFPLIITLWFIGIIVLTLKFLGGLAYVQRLKKYKVADITTAWEDKLKHISAKVGLKKSVRLLESSLVAVPMVVGYISPVILLPLGMVAGLTINQVEAILTHELAHIYRKDYLVNISQTLIEIIFFYHPAIWWISSRVREERENCCDDIAVEVNADSLVYVKALTTLGEKQLNVKAPSLALAATGSNGTLFKRVKRILSQPRQNPTFSEGFIAACIIFAGIFFLSLVARANFSSDRVKSAFSEVHEIVNIQEGDSRAISLMLNDSTGKNNNLIVVKNKKGKIVELFVNGKKVPKDQIGNYRSLIEESLAQQSHPKTNDGSAHSNDDGTVKNMMDEVKDADNDKAVEAPEAPEAPEIAEVPEAPEAPEIPPFDDQRSSEIISGFTKSSVEMAKLGLEMGKLNMKMESLKQKMLKPSADKEEIESSLQNLREQTKELEEEMEELSHEMEELGPEFGKLSMDIASRVLDSIDFSGKGKNKEIKHKEIKHKEIKRPFPKVKRETSTLEEELLKDNLIKSNNSYKLKINEKGLWIDGKKQSDQLYEKYNKIVGGEARYISKEISYNNKDDKHESSDAEEKEKRLYSGKTGGMEQKIERELLHDRLISPHQPYEFRINDSDLWINDQRKSGQLFKKYQKITGSRDLHFSKSKR